MAQALRTKAGPWCGAVTDTSATIRATLLKSATSSRLIVAEDEELTTGRMEFDARSIVSFPQTNYKPKIATFRAEGLHPDTQYHYQLEIDRTLGDALPGRFRTFPPAGSRSSFRFALGCCSKPKWFGGSRPEAYKAICREDALFFFHLGDFHYENINSDDMEPRLNAYDDMLRRDGIGDLIRTMPLVYGWDDHDFLGNNSEGGDPDNRITGRVARDAYDMYVPHYEFINPLDGIYQSFTVGRVLFLLTDTRSQKSPRSGSGTSAKTVLGPNQKLWLKSRLLAGKTMDLIVWANSIPWIGEAKPGEDFWAGYSEERRELANFIESNAIQNVCMISGDAHMMAIDDGSNSGYADGGKGGFPVFHSASLESPGSEKGGPFSMGREGGKRGFGIPENRQYGVFEVAYSDGSDSPRVTWIGKRAEKESAAVKVLIQHEFDAANTFQRV